MKEISASHCNRALVALLGLFGVSLVMPWIGSGFFGFQSFAGSFYILVVGIPGLFLAMAHPLWVVTLIGIHQRQAWAVPTGTLALASIICWGIAGPGYLVGEMFGLRGGGLGPGYFAWLVCGTAALSLAVRASAPGGRLLRRPTIWIAAVAASALCWAYGVRDTLSTPAIFESTEDTLLSQVIRFENPILQGLPESERPEAIAVFQWLENQGSGMDGKEVMACAEAVRQFENSRDMTQPQRSRIVVSQLKGVVEAARTARR
jgi:hypothetical protein